MIVVKEVEFEDTTGRIRQSKDRKHNDQTKKNKLTNYDLQNIAYKTKDRVIQRKVTFIYCENSI
jgi:hypothetical protein